VNLENSGWVANFSLPVFSRKTQESIDNSQVVKGVRSEIITSLAWEIWQHTQYPSSEDYNKICKMLVQKHPILKDTIGNGYVSNKFIISIIAHILVF